MTKFEKEVLEKLDQVIAQLGVLNTFYKPWWIFSSYNYETCLCHLKTENTWVTCPTHDSLTVMYDGTTKEGE